MRERYRKFVAAYLRGLNGTQAAIKAGYRVKSATCAGTRLLKIPEIAAAIAAGKKEIVAERCVTADRVLREYARIAFSDMRNYVDWDKDGIKLMPQEAIDDFKAGAIADIDISQDGAVAKVKLHDKKAALDMVARHVGLIAPTGKRPTYDQTPAGAATRSELGQRLRRIIKNGGSE
jgi:phage terminase small subunit